MENENGLSDPNSFSYNSRYAPLSPYPFSGAVESKGNFKSLESANNCHQCRSSESFPAEEEQPSWLDDLLNDSETFTHRGHRRSASDSYAFLGGEAAATLTSKFVNLSVEDSFETKANSNADENNNNQELEELVYNIAVDHRRDESSSQSTEGSGDRASGAQANNSGSKAESKRAKQHNAPRPRVRKLQYIAHLERTVQILKAEGTEVSAELEFLEQQNLILTMENRALRQRMESISQEQIIKHWEQGMLEREIGRLQTLYHLQNQQQMQMHHQQKQQQPNKGHPKHHRNRSRDHLDHQINNSTLKNKDVRDSVNGPINGPIRA